MEKKKLLFTAETLASDWNDFYLKEPVDILMLGRFLLKNEVDTENTASSVLGENSEYLLVCVGDSIWSLLDRDLTKILLSAGFEFSTLREYGNLAPHIPICKAFTLETLEAMKLKVNATDHEKHLKESLKDSDKKLKSLEESVNTRNPSERKTKPGNLSVSEGLKESMTDSKNDDESEEFDD